MGTAGQSITLANSIIGVGILAMPFCFQQCGVLLATLILLFMGLVSRLCCYFILKSALLARRRNFEFLAFHVFGPAGKLAVEIGIIGFLMGTCIAYFVVVGDLGPQIIAKLFNINQSDILRTSIMVLVSLLCVLPLGLLRNVDSLSNVSAATIGFYFCLVMKVIAEAASQLLTREWQVHMELWKPSGVLQCVPIFSMALFCQTQLFEIFESLPSLSLEKMNLVTKNAINICTSVYFTLGVFGYIAFCSQQISGNILMSLSPTMASDVIKLGFVMSLAFSFPLIIFPCRASLYSLLYKKVHSTHHDHIINHSIPESSFRCITVAIIAVTLFISLLIPNIELVLGLVGSTIGVMICIVFPAACFINVTFKNTNERVLAKGVLVLGLIIMVLGTYANLQAAESQMDKYDERYITPERIDKMVEEFFEKMDKSDDGVMVKPIDKNDVKIDDNVIKDSMVLPPNPVPPESNEKPAGKEQPKHEQFNVIDEPNIDTVSGTHPKNLNKNNDVKLSNGDNSKVNIEKPKEKEKQEVNEDKKEIEKKQQKLIETIKQHGEEQKELLKEQKVILDEILKTKKEMEQKNEADSNEAKKIAVESIKKIADMAIQSLAGVSEKPSKVEDINDVGKLADEAVQEIAKKAVETIAAIKEINEKVVPNSAPSASQNVQQAVPNAPNVPQNVLQSAQNNPQPPQSNPQVQNMPQSAQNVAQLAQNVPQLAQNVAQPAQNVPQSAQNVPQSAQNIVPPAQNVAQPAQNVPQSAQNIVPPVQNVAQPAQNVPQSAQNIVPPAQNVAQPAQNVPQSAQNIVPPVQNVAQPAQNVPQSAQNIVPPAQNVAQPAQNVPQSAQNIVPSAQSVPQSAQNSPQLAPINPELEQNGQQPAQNIQPAQNPQLPVQNVPQPPENAQHLAQNIQQPQNVPQSVQNAQQQSSNVQQPQNIVPGDQNAPQSMQNVQQPAQTALNNQQPQNPQQPIQNVQQAAPKIPAVAPQAQNMAIPAQNVQQPSQVVQQPAQNQPAQNIPQPIQNAPQPVQNGQQPQNVPNVQPPAQNSPQGAKEQVSNIQKPENALLSNVQPNVAQFVSNNLPNQPPQNENLQAQKEHSHSPDEPKSYQQGEDAQKLDSSNINNIIQAIADNIQNPVEDTKLNGDHGKPRQKREVVDCTETSTLKPEDRKICERLVNVPQYKVNDKIDFPKVDLGDLPRSLPLDANMIHIGRSLKSYDEHENR